MSKRIGVLACILILPFLHAAAQPADPQSAPALQSGVPEWISFSGTLKDSAGRPVTSVAEVIFAIYGDAEGGSALWTEIQRVTPNEQGRFTVPLGSKSGGVPVELFLTSEPRWLGIEGSGFVEQPRVLLVSVPYALRAADAQTLAGRPASEYALAAPPGDGTAANAAAASKASPQSSSITGSGTPGYLARFFSQSALGNSLLYQSGNFIGIGTTKPTQTLDLSGNVKIDGTGHGIYFPDGSFQSAGFAANEFARLGTAANPLTQNLYGTLNLNGGVIIDPLNDVDPTFEIRDAKGEVLGLGGTAAAGKSIANAGGGGSSALWLYRNLLLREPAGGPLPSIGFADGSTLTTGNLALLGTSGAPVKNTFFGSQDFQGNVTLSSGGALTTPSISAGNASFSGNTTFVGNNSFANISVFNGSSSAGTTFLPGQTTYSDSSGNTGGVTFQNGSMNSTANGMTFTGTGSGNALSFSSPQGTVAITGNALSLSAGGSTPNTSRAEISIGGSGTASGTIFIGPASGDNIFLGTSNGGTTFLGSTGSGSTTLSFPSTPLGFQTSVANNAGATEAPTLALQAAPTGANTATPSAQLNFLSSSNGNTFSPTGLSFAGNGIITFASGQTFPGTTAIAAGLGIKLSGNNTLSVDPAVVGTYAGNGAWTGNNTFSGQLSFDGFTATSASIGALGVTGAAASTFSGGVSSPYLNLTQGAGSNLPAVQINGAGGNAATTLLQANGASGSLLNISASGAGGSGGGIVNLQGATGGALDLTGGSGSVNISGNQGLQITGNTGQSVLVNGGNSPTGTSTGALGDGAAIEVDSGDSNGDGGELDLGSGGGNNVPGAATNGGNIDIETGNGANGGATGDLNFSTALQPANSVNGGDILIGGSGTLTLSNSTISGNVIATNSSVKLNSSSVVLTTAGALAGAPGGTVTLSGDTLTIDGSIDVTGNKNAIVPAADGRMVAVHAVESPESWFEDFGSAQLHNGVARVTIDAAFLETVNSSIGYHVFLTPLGNCRGLYVARRDAKGFEVRELGGGRASIAFDYRVVAKRRGYETERLETVAGLPGPAGKQ